MTTNIKTKKAIISNATLEFRHHTILVYEWIFILRSARIEEQLTEFNNRKLLVCLNNYLIIIPFFSIFKIILFKW